MKGTERRTEKMKRTNRKKHKQKNREKISTQTS